MVYHLVFCPKYRRKIFLIPGIKERFHEITERICKDHDIYILSLDFGEDYVYMEVDIPPEINIKDAIREIKAATSSSLRQEFVKLSSMHSLWTRSYFLSTEESIDKDTINGFLAAQKRRP